MSLLSISISISAHSSAPVVLGLNPPQTLDVRALWPNGAPGFESLRDQPEESKDWWVRHINNPSVTVFLPPKDRATGAAIVIAPGGGHSLLSYDGEGLKPAAFLNRLGIAAFVLKYRLARETNSPYKIEIHAKQDGYRAIRYVRAHAAEFGVDPQKVGILGFSAGGEVAGLVSYDSGLGDAHAPDPVDRESGKPNFEMLVYPGPIGFPAVVPSDSPPTFMLVSNDDAGHSDVIVRLISAYRAAKVPLEAHILSGGGHGYGMADRAKLSAVRKWRDRLADWLQDLGYGRELETR